MSRMSDYLVSRIGTSDDYKDYLSNAYPLYNGTEPSQSDDGTFSYAAKNFLGGLAPVVGGGLNYVGSLLNSMDENGRASSLSDSIKNGGPGVLHSAGDWFINNGEYLNRYGEDINQRYKNHAYEGMSIPDRLTSIDYLTDKGGLLADVTNGFGSSLPFLVGTAVTPEITLPARSVGLISSLLGRAGAKRLASAIGPTAEKVVVDGAEQIVNKPSWAMNAANDFGNWALKSGPLEAATNAGTSYNDLKNMGLSDSEIYSRMNDMVAEELPIDMATSGLFGAILGGNTFSRLGKGGLKRAVAANALSVPAEMGSEYLQEMGQQRVQNKYSGREYGTWLNPTADELEAGRVAAIGALPMALFGMGKGVRNSRRLAENPTQGGTQGNPSPTPPGLQPGQRDITTSGTQAYADWWANQLAGLRLQTPTQGAPSTQNAQNTQGKPSSNGANANLGAGTHDMPTQGDSITAQVQNLKSGWESVLPQIGGVLKNKFGMDGVISSGARDEQHNADVGGSPTSHHIDHGNGGDAVDIVLPDGTTQEQAEAVKSYFENSGAFDEVLFHDAGSGYHLHLGGLKGGLQEGDTQQGAQNAAQGGTLTKSSGNADYDAWIQQYADQYGVPANLLSSLLDVESGYNPNAQSDAGAVGIAQFMPSTAESIGIDPMNPQQAIEGAAIYLKQKYDKYGNWHQALEAYNGGDGNVGIAETEAYADKVLGGAGNITDTTQRAKYKAADVVNLLGNKMIDFAGTDMQDIEDAYAHVMDGIDDATKAKLPGMFDQQGKFINTAANRSAIASDQEAANLLRSLVAQKATELHPELSQMISSDGLISISDARKLLTSPIGAKQASGTQGNPTPHIDMAHLMDGKVFPTARLQNIVGQIENAGSNEDILFLQSLQNANGKIVYTPQTKQAILDHFGKDRIESELATLELNEQRNAQQNGQANPAPSPQPSPQTNSAPQPTPAPQPAPQPQGAPSAQENAQVNPAPQAQPTQETAPQDAETAQAEADLADALQETPSRRFDPNIGAWILKNPDEGQAKPYQEQPLTTPPANPQAAPTQTVTPDMVQTEAQQAAEAQRVQAKAQQITEKDIKARTAELNAMKPSKRKAAGEIAKANADLAGVELSPKVANGIEQNNAGAIAYAEKQLEAAQNENENAPARQNPEARADQNQNAEPETSHEPERREENQDAQEVTGKAALRELSDDAIAMVKQYQDPASVPLNRFSQEEQAILRRAGIVRTLEAEDGHPYEAALSEPILEEGDRRLKESYGGKEENDGGKGNSAQNAERKEPAKTQESTEEPKAEEENKPVIGRTGKTVTVATDNGTPIEAKYRLVPQKSLVMSNLYADGAIVENPAYPQDVQPRDRTGRKELRAQTDKIATQMQPEKLGASVNLNQGAPIIRSDGVVLNGNGRTMGILHARELKNDSAKRYDKWLLDNAESFGYTKDAVRDLLNGDGHPVLVREVGDLDKATLDEVINSTTGGASMGAAEQAASDAARITSKDFAEYDPESGGDITKASNDNFVARLLRRLVPESDMNRYTDKNGSINQDGYQRVKRAMFSAAYQDASLIAKMAESMDDAIRNISNGLQAAAASVARINRKMDEGTAYKYPLAKSIADAVKKYNAIKEGKAEANVEEFVNANANALFEGYDPEAVELVKAFDEYRKSGKKVGAFLNNLVTEIERQGDPKEDEQATLLPIKKRVKTFDAIIHDAKARVEDGGQQDLFGAQQETRETKETNPQAKEAEESAPTDAEDFQSAIDTMDKNARALFDGTEGSLETVQRGIDNAITSYTNRTKTVDARRVSQLESYGREIISDLRKKAKKENASNREDAFHVKLGGVDVYVDAATLDPITKKFPRLKAYIDTILKSAKTNKGSAKKLAQLVTMNADDQATVAAGYIYNQAAVNYEAEKARGNEDIDMEATLGAARTVLSDLQKGDVSPQEAYRELDSILPETKPADLTGLEVEEAAKVKPLDLIKKAKDIYDAYASKKQKPDDALAALDEIEKGTQNENVVKRVQQIRTEIVNRSTSKYKELRKILKKYENGEDGKMPLADLMKQLHENHAYTLTSAQMNRLDEMASDIEKKSAKAKAETPVAPNDSVFGSVEDADKELFDELGINPNEEETLTAPDGIVNTKEERERIKEELRKELNKISVNPMFNPKIYELGAKLAFTYIKDGVNTVKKLIATLHEDFGDSITPWAPAIVETVRTWPQGVAFDEKKVRAIAKAVGARYESGLTTREAVQKDLKEKLGRSYDSYAPMIDAAYNGIEKFFNPETTQEVSTNGQESQPSGSASGRHESVQSEDVSEVPEGRNEPGGRGGKLSRSRTEDARGNVPASESANPAESQPAGSRPEGKRNEDAGAGNSERGHHGLAALRDDQKQPAATKTAGHDYEIKDDGPAPTTPAKRIQANLAAIKLLNQLESENRLPTPAEQEVLAAYSSWGGLTNAFKDGTKENTELRALLSKEDYDAAKRSILDAYFTPPAIVRAIWKGVSSLGFQGGRVFDPSMGVGNFFGCMPKAMRKASSLSGVELDRLSSRFAKMLYPSASVENTGFQNAHVADGSFDLVISNVPFNQTKVGKYALHNFFFAQGIDKVRPGGLMVFITSQSSLTSSGDAATMRRYLASKADLLGAFKLPSGVFKGTGTEVGTDVLVFQRRQENNRESGYGNNFQNVSTFQGSEAKVNDYFSEHPENVLGTQKLGKDQYKNDVVEVTAKKGQDTAKELEAAMAKLPHVYEPVNRTDTKPYQQKPADLKARDDEKRRDQEYFEKDGKLYQNQGETATEVPKRKQAVVKSYLGVKNALRSLFIAENDPNAKETTLDVLRKKLNAAYDAFIGKHGFLSEPKNVRLFGDDPNAGMVLALEKNVKLDGKGAKRHVTSAEKTDIFYQRTVQAVKPVTHAKNASDALLASLNHVGGVDVDYMAKLTGKSPEAVIKELGDAIYQDPTTGAYETKDEYLSGNVREKLAQAQEAAKKDARYHRNVDALKAVIPADLVSSEILVNMDAPWVPESDLNAFLEHLTGQTGGSYKGLSAHRMPNGKIEVGGLGWGGEKWASNGITLHDIIDCILNNKPIEVYNRGDHNKKLDLNKEKTDAANAAADRIRDEFQDWIWKDKEREQRLTKYYNENFNNEVSRKYNGAHLTFPGMNSLIKLRAHQKNIVWRMLQKANTLIAHCVGAGKTFEMQAAGMEMRRLGIANKPLYCVPNNIVEQFAREFQTLYPNAKLLVLKTGDDLPEVYRAKTIKTDDGRKLVEKIDVTKMTKDEREKYEAKCRARLRALTRIKTEDWDGIIMSHNMFERLPVSGETAAAYIQEEIDILDRTLKEAQARRGDGNAIRNLEQRKETLQNRLEEALNQDTKAVGIPFEELGIDQIFVDEADMFKNLSYMTTIGNVSGLVNPKSANRSTDMFVKTQWLTKHNGGRGVVFATGTPISNTMAEMYTMMRYLDLDGLKQKGLDLFDNWIRQYGDIGTGIERKPSGDGFRKVQKVKRFLNMPELAKAFRKFTDVFTREELEAEDESVKLPHMKDGKRTVIALEPDPVIVDYIKNVVPKRLKNMKGRRQMQKGDDNMLALTNDLRKLSMTDKKIDACAEQVARKFQETSDRSGAQAIFCDMGVPKAQKDDATATDRDADVDSAEAENKAVYTRLMESLVAHGIPREQIAFVQEAKNKQAQDEMFQKVDNGELRVIIGSTQKMGAGTNFQHHLVAEHHLDAPWRPRDIEQREGRIIRQGNPNSEVEIFTYVVKDSFDANMWEKIKNKAAIIQQAMSDNIADRSVEDADLVTLSYADVEGAATGNPLIRKKLDADAEVAKYTNASVQFQRNQRNAEDKVQSLPAKIEQAKEIVARVENDANERTDTHGENFHMEVAGKAYDKRADADKALAAVELSSKPQDIGSIAGFKIRAWQSMEGETHVQLVRNRAYIAPKLGTASIENTLRGGIDKALEGRKADLAAMQNELKDAQEILSEENPYAEKLKAARQKQHDLEQLINNEMTEGEKTGDTTPADSEPTATEEPEPTTPTPKAQATAETTQPAQSEQAATPTETQAAGLFDTSDFCHTKTGKMIPAAKMLERVSTDVFRQAKSIAHTLDGSWSQFAHRFLFTSAEDRDTFVQEVSKIMREEQGTQTTEAPAQETPDTQSKQSEAATVEQAKPKFVAAPSSKVIAKAKTFEAIRKRVRENLGDDWKVQDSSDYQRKIYNIVSGFTSDKYFVEGGIGEYRLVKYTEPTTHYSINKDAGARFKVQALDSLEKDINNAFKGVGKIHHTETANGEHEFSFRFQNGTKMLIQTAGRIRLDEDQAKAAREAHGYEPGSKIIVNGVAATREGMASLLLSRITNAVGTVYHEAFHVAYDLFLTNKEKGVIERAYGELAKAEGKTTIEYAADRYRDWVVSKLTGGEFHDYGKLWQKVHDGAQATEEIMKNAEAAAQIFDDIDSGKIWQRPLDMKTRELHNEIRETFWNEVNEKLASMKSPTDDEIDSLFYNARAICQLRAAFNFERRNNADLAFEFSSLFDSLGREFEHHETVSNIRKKNGNGSAASSGGVREHDGASSSRYAAQGTDRTLESGDSGRVSESSGGISVLKLHDGKAIHDYYNDNKAAYHQRKIEQLEGRPGNQGGFYDGNFTNIHYSIAYHGTQHEFDQFDVGAIGTGEGTQVHGWGLYFAKDRKVSENYHDKLSSQKDEVTINGKTYHEAQDENFLDLVDAKVLDANEREPNGKGINEAVRALLYYEEKDKALRFVERNSYLSNDLKAAEDILRNADISFKEQKGMLAEVEIPDDDVMLDEQKTFDEQPEKVKKALETIGVSSANARGKDIYKTLSWKAGGNRAASLLLKAHGVKGIKYHGGRDGDCYVVFDDKAVSIIRKLSATRAEAAHARAVEDLKREILRAFPGAKNIVGEGSRMTFTMPNGAKVEIRLKNSMHLTPEQAARERKSRGYAEDVSITVNGSEVTLGGKAFIELSKAGKKGTIYHEALHAAIDLCLTKKQKAALMKRYGGDEERMADAYRDYMLGKTHDMGKLWTLVHAIAKNIGDAIFAIREGLDAARTAREAFRQLSTGEAWGAPAPRKRSRGFSLFSRAEAAERTIDNGAAQGDNEGEERAAFIDDFLNKNVPEKGRTAIASDVKNGIDQFKEEITPENVEDVFDSLRSVRMLRATFNDAGRMQSYKNGLAYARNTAAYLYGYARRCFENDERIQRQLALRGASLGRPETVRSADAQGRAGRSDAGASRNGEPALTGTSLAKHGNVSALQEAYDKIINEEYSKHGQQHSVSRSESQDGFSSAGNRRYSVSEAEKSAKDFVKAANDKLKRKLGLTSDDMQIDKEQQAPNKKIGLLQKTVLSPHVVADKVALFRPLYQMATRAMDVLVHNRNRYNQKLDQALFLVNKEEKADLYDRLLQGDAEGKEWTRQELIDDGASENVADAYIAIRRLMTKAYHMVNDARRHPEPKTKTVTRSELDALKANHFVTSIDKVEDLGNGRYKVSYKEVRHYNNVYRDVTQDAINIYESDPRMEVLEAKANGRTDFDGNPLYDVTVMEGPADLTKLTGYIPHFFHEYLLRVVEKDGKTYVVGSGRTQREAVKNGEAYLKAHTLPEGATLHVQPKVFDFSRVGMSEKEYAPIMGDRDFYRMVSNLAQQNNMTVREAKEMLDGNVRLKGRHRFFGNALHRTGAEGYETNLDWVLRHYFNSAARYAAMETEFKPKAISYFERMFGKFDDDHADNALARFAKDYINDINGNPNAIEQAINDALKSSAFYRNVIVPTFGDRAALTIGNAISRKVSYLTLGLNMSSALLNLTQLVNSAAYLGDPRLIGKMLAKGRHRKYTYKELRILHETGVFSDIGLDSGSGYDQMRSRSAAFGKNRFTRALSTANGFMDFIGDKSMLMFREMDAICRRGTVLAAYEKAVKEGKTHAQAIAYARDINLKANFQYGVQDAANAFRRGSILSQLALQFKKYGFKELEVMADFMPGSKKTTLAQKAMFWGMYLAICGVMGIPALDWLDDVLGSDKRGYPKDAIQKWVIAHFPKKIAAAILYGLPALADINLSSRAGLADVIPTQGINCLGPTISKAVNLKRDAWDNGDFASSLRDISPGAYNLYAAYVGESRGKRGRLNDRYDSAWDKLLRAIGFRSVKESAPVDMQRILTHENAARTAEKQRAQDDYLEHPTIENAQRLRDLGIKDSTVTKEAQKKEQTREERMEGRAPKKGAEGIQSLIDFAKGD